ncbi:MAG TPA: hypothetical protein VFE03_05960 [Caulobacteraceae bacterium]|jgi:hypothetical protein|nr:hypothetical protein [Caulobacteraceae bacterium]
MSRKPLPPFAGTDESHAERLARQVATLDRLAEIGATMARDLAASASAAACAKEQAALTRAVQRIEREARLARALRDKLERQRTREVLAFLRTATSQLIH